MDPRNADLETQYKAIMLQIYSLANGARLTTEEAVQRICNPPPPLAPVGHVLRIKSTKEEDEHLIERFAKDNAEASELYARAQKLKDNSNILSKK